MSERDQQLDEVWRVAKLRHQGTASADLTQFTGPLSLGSLRIYLQSIKEMLRGAQYTRAMKNDDTDYFLTRIANEFGKPALALALHAMDQHISYYGAQGKGELRGARSLLDRWLIKSAQTSNSPESATILDTAQSRPLGDVRLRDTGSVAASENLPTLAAHLVQSADDLRLALARSPTARAARLAAADPVPQTRTVTTTIHLRNMDVVAEVLHRSRGLCEACAKPAPFARRTDGTPYLEVHHRIPLAENGPDTTQNAVALCPNCHRKAHHGPL